MERMFLTFFFRQPETSLWEHQAKSHDVQQRPRVDHLFAFTRHHGLPQ